MKIPSARSKDQNLHMRSVSRPFDYVIVVPYIENVASNMISFGVIYS